MLIVLLASSCKEDNFHFDRLVETDYNGNMMEYLKSDDYNWSMTVEMIHRAATNPGDEYLIDLFEAKSELRKEITFLGFTNHSIRRWMYGTRWVIPSDQIPEDPENPGNPMVKTEYENVSQIPVSVCAFFVKTHILMEARNKDSFEVAKLDMSIPDYVGKTELELLFGNRIWIWKTDENAANSPGLLPTTLTISTTKFKNIPVASSDIHPTNGYVHSLQYSYTLGDITK